MTVRIISDADRLPMTDVNDVRSFVAGEIMELHPEHEQHLIELGIAEPIEGQPEPADTMTEDEANDFEALNAANAKALDALRELKAAEATDTEHAATE